MIYFVQAGKNGPIKIGHTNNDVKQRIRELQNGCPYELRLLWAVQGGLKDELEIHQMFLHERVRGEWFHPSKKLLDYIEHDACNHTEVPVGDGLVGVTETKNEISVDCGGWSVTENKNISEVSFYIDDYLPIHIDIGGKRFGDLQLILRKDFILINCEDDEMFGGVIINIMGKKVVVEND